MKINGSAAELRLVLSVELESGERARACGVYADIAGRVHRVTLAPDAPGGVFRSVGAGELERAQLVGEFTAGRKPLATERVEHANGAIVVYAARTRTQLAHTWACHRVRCGAFDLSPAGDMTPPRAEAEPLGLIRDATPEEIRAYADELEQLASIAEQIESEQRAAYEMRQQTIAELNARDAAAPPEEQPQPG